jgi:hypothetical protein
MLFLGPMSKNVVDTAIELSLKDSSVGVTFIPSRRQIEYSGGYVNYWTTADFCKYVKSSNPNIQIERDHGGPGQGATEDDGYYSLAEDCKYMDIIHIDPWKLYKTLEEGTKWTIDMIRFCNERNPNLTYEIGTEEAIRRFNVSEMDEFVNAVKSEIGSELYAKIKYLVIQCGTGLCERTNTGSFERDRLSEMLTLAKQHGLTPKEHNGDWVPKETNTQKRKIGLENINIAPELGEIETRVILDTVNDEEFEEIFQMCLKSGKWKKWVSGDFDPHSNKRELILIAGHYVFPTPDFVKIKNRYPNIDTPIRSAIMNKLHCLLGIYTMRTECVICRSNNLKDVTKDSLITYLSLEMSKDLIKTTKYMPYTIQGCDSCGGIQNKYIGDLSIIYKNNHVENFGTSKPKMHSGFSNFITQNTEINGIVEIGASVDTLAKSILNRKQTPYYIIEPSYQSEISQDITFIGDFVENVDLSSLNINTIVMSHVFEHIYEPSSLLQIFSKHKNIKYIYLNHPDMEYAVKNNIAVILNAEHTFYIETAGLLDLFRKNMFNSSRITHFDNHSIYLEFERKEILSSALPHNSSAYTDVVKWVSNLKIAMKTINKYMLNNPSKNYYIWPASCHSTILFIFGLDHTKFTGVLDNSPNKIGRYLYGYDLLCSSLNEFVEHDPNNSCIIISPAGIYSDEISTSTKNAVVINVNDLVNRN